MVSSTLNIKVSPFCSYTGSTETFNTGESETLPFSQDTKPSNTQTAMYILCIFFIFISFKLPTRILTQFLVDPQLRCWNRPYNISFRGICIYFLGVTQYQSSSCGYF